MAGGRHDLHIVDEFDNMIETLMFHYVASPMCYCDAFEKCETQLWHMWEPVNYALSMRYLIQLMCHYRVNFKKN